MAARLWGWVHFRESLAGLLEQDTAGRCVFTYDPAYLDAGEPAIAHTLPLRREPYRHDGGLHPFFDNLAAEGWLARAQARALRVPAQDRLTLLLAYGQDCAGAVSVVDPAPPREPELDLADPDAVAALGARASLSGIQPKLFAIREGDRYRPARAGELSTHIAKLPSGSLPDILEIERLTARAVQALLPDDPVAEMEMAPLGNQRALMVRRFDRTPSGRKLHFEEFSQLLGKPTGDAKYQGPYCDMARFVRSTPGCLPAEVDRLFRRVLACLLTGNTDAHLKNFAMMHTPDGLRLTPSYDLVASALYPDFQAIALAIGPARDVRIDQLQPKHVVMLGEGFGLPPGAIRLAIGDLGKRLEAAEAAVIGADEGSAPLRARLADRMRTRWNGSFGSTGALLSKRRSGGDRLRGLLRGG